MHDPDISMLAGFALGILAGVVGCLLIRHLRRGGSRVLPRSRPLSEDLYRAHRAATPVAERVAFPETLGECAAGVRSVWLAVAQCAIRRLGTVLVLAVLGLSACAHRIQYNKDCATKLDRGTAAIEKYKADTDEAEGKILTEAGAQDAAAPLRAVHRAQYDRAKPLIDALLGLAQEVCR